MKPDLLVMTSSSYHDVIPIFFKAISRHRFSDCFNRIHLVSDADVQFEGYNQLFKTKINLNIVRNESWQGRLKAALKEVGSNEVVLLLEDYILSREFDVAEFQSLVKDFRKSRVAYCRITHIPPQRKVCCSINSVDSFRILDAAVHYGVSLQPALWNKMKLESLLTSSGSAWDLEKLFLSASASGKPPLPGEKFAVSNKDLFTYNNLIIKGKWFPSSYRKVSKQYSDLKKLKCNREFMSFKDLVRLYSFSRISRIMSPRSRKWAKRVGRYIGIKFYSEN